MRKKFAKGGLITRKEIDEGMTRFGSPMHGYNTSEGLECWWCLTVFTDPDISKRHEAFYQHICPRGDE